MRAPTLAAYAALLPLLTGCAGDAPSEPIQRIQYGLLQPSFTELELAHGQSGAVLQATNVGQAEILVRDVALSVGEDFQVTSSTCKETLQAGEACAVALAFVPVGRGQRQDILTIYASDGPHMIALEGVN